MRARACQEVFVAFLRQFNDDDMFVFGFLGHTLIHTYTGEIDTVGNQIHST